MIRVVVAATLILCFLLYSLLVYTKGTASEIKLPLHEAQLVNQGKILYQEKNCQACHQVYGLGGYLGPDLTTAYSDKKRGAAYLQAMLQTGGNRMPNFHFTDAEIQSLLSYLKYVDRTATPAKSPYQP